MTLSVAILSRCVLVVCTLGYKYRARKLVAIPPLGRESKRAIASSFCVEVARLSHFMYLMFLGFGVIGKEWCYPSLDRFPLRWFSSPQREGRVKVRLFKKRPASYAPLQKSPSTEMCTSFSVLFLVFIFSSPPPTPRPGLVFQKQCEDIV